VLSATLASVNSKPMLFSVTSKQNLFIIDLDSMKEVNRRKLDKPTTLLKAFEAAPDMVFIAVQVGMQSFLQVILPQGMINSEEAHNGFITDIHFMKWNGTDVVFTACQDQNLRAFTFSSDKTKLERQAIQPTSPSYATKFVSNQDSFLIAALRDGSFLGWNLNQNQVDKQPGHDMNKEITSLLMHQTCVLSADEGGVIQIRNLSEGFQQIVPPLSISPGALQTNQTHQVQSMIVMEFPPSNDPVILTGSKNGLVQLVKPNLPPYQFGAHNYKPN